MHTIISIGLNVGATEPVGQLEATLRVLADLGGYRGHVGSLRYTIGESEWEGVPERFVQARLPRKPSREELAAAARVLGQSAVATLRPGDAAWTLTYSDGHTEPGGTVDEFEVVIHAPGCGYLADGYRAHCDCWPR